jgi:hypothetical protein
MHFSGGMRLDECQIAYKRNQLEGERQRFSVGWFMDGLRPCPYNCHFANYLACSPSKGPEQIGVKISFKDVGVTALS